MTPLADSDFAAEGGFEKAYWMLLYEAKDIIGRRSGLTAGGAEVALIQPTDLLGHAIDRFIKEPGVTQPGRTVYDQLRAYMDDHAHSIRYGKDQQKRIHLNELQKGDSSLDVDDFKDGTAIDPRAELEKQEQDVADQKLIDEVRKQFSRNSDEHKIIDVLLEGVEKRADAIAKLKMPANKYDAAVKRIERASVKIKAAFAKRK